MAPEPSTAYRNYPASLAGEIFLFSKAIRRLQLVRDFRHDVLVWFRPVAAWLARV